jgi:hypothetical protein
VQALSEAEELQIAAKSLQISQIPAIADRTASG